MFAQTKQQNSLSELEEIRLEIDRGLSSAAQKRLSVFLNQNRYDAELAARAKCLLGESLELQGKHSEAVETLRIYEAENALSKLEFETRIRVKVRLALAYNYTGDFPKAIALLKSALRAVDNYKNDASLGAVYLALSRIYRTINEYRIARDHAEKSLAHFRTTGDWRGLSESYFAVALVELFEGEYEPALEHLEQVLKLVGENPAAYLLGMTYTNLAAVCIFTRRVNDGLSHLEKAVEYYETTEHQTNAIAGYNNLGVHLMFLGDWTRAETELRKALEIAENLDSRSAKLPMVLDSLGELKILQGKLSEARKLLEKAVEIAEEHQNQWYACQSLRSLGKCFLAEKNAPKILNTAEKVLRIGEKIGDRQAVREARLLKTEAFLLTNSFEKCAENLEFLSNEISQTQIDLGFVGEVQRLQGVFAISKNNYETARQHFGKSVSIFEMLGDRYRLAVANFWLGYSFGKTDSRRAEKLIARSISDFATMGATLELKRAEAEFLKLSGEQIFIETNAATLIHSLTARLADSTVSRELLLHELASVLRLETAAENILLLSFDGFNKLNIEARCGFSGEKNLLLYREIENQKDAAQFEEFAKKKDLFFRKFHTPEDKPTFLVVAPLASAVLPENLSLEPLLKIVEIGLMVCASREHHAPKKREEFQKVSVEKEMPDFIHTSPAMENLVEEIRKIRSSDVTVLITGESGTGKELVAQSVHKLSARNDKVFIPFNCTAVPKELADAYLFGYRKGAFTGAATSSEGVIRAASGGTLFLDEIGDLPLDIQPKLLRFLQEGEIHPLGESQPQKTDVRIIAATNADLEQMVLDGTFREDLYYRLNIIRLPVPPLRNRRSEIPALINHYVKIYAENFDRSNISFAPETIDLLTVCDWKGNIRQLCNEIQRIIARADDNSVISPEDISPELRPNALTKTENRAEEFSVGLDLPLHGAVERLEKDMIAAALQKTGNNISHSARQLGLTRRGLQLKMGRYNFKRNSA
jgi:hydrogenase-4 transcriptional activator